VVREVAKLNHAYWQKRGWQILEIAGPRRYTTALIGQEILIPPNSPSAGVKVETILDHGAPIELMEFCPRQEAQDE
jgi:hypothetical protein